MVVDCNNHRNLRTPPNATPPKGNVGLSTGHCPFKSLNNPIHIHQPLFNYPLTYIIHLRIWPYFLWRKPWHFPLDSHENKPGCLFDQGYRPFNGHTSSSPCFTLPEGCSAYDAEKGAEEVERCLGNEPGDKWWLIFPTMLHVGDMET